MASACNFLAPNNEPSDLAAALEQLYGPAETTKMMAVLRSAEALKVFDWVNNTQYNTDKQELTPEVAKALYDAVVSGTKFKAPVKYTNHSGGAIGGDTAWDMIGREFGVTDHRHYREPGQSTVDSAELRAQGITAIPASTADYEEGKLKATKATEDLGRKISAAGAHYQYRNWLQVKYADAVFAVSSIVNPGQRNDKGFVSKAKHQVVDGGTGYAVQMAINEGKPVHVFDQKQNSWFFWNGTEFESEQTPTLTPNFAGIGSRTITPAGLQAVRDVYESTINSAAPVAAPVDSTPYSVADFLPDTVVGIKNLHIDKVALNKTLRSMLPEILDADGKPTGELYSFEDHKAINELITGRLLAYLLPKLTGANGKVDVVNELVAGLNQSKGIIKTTAKLMELVAVGKTPPLPATHAFAELVKTMTPEQAQALANKYNQALHSYPNIVRFTAESLKEYGIEIKPKVIDRLTKMLNYDQKAIVPDGAEVVVELPEELVDYSASLDEGKSIQSYSEKAINLDLHSTASKNVKMFLAGLTAMEFSKAQTRKGTETTATASLEDVMRMAKRSLSSTRKTETLNHFKLQPKLNSLMQPVLVDHKDLFIKLLKVAQTLPEFRKSTVIDRLKKSIDPDLVNLGVALETAPEQITNELFKVVNNQYSVNTKVLVGFKDDKGKDAVSARNIVANKGNETSTIIEEWRENQKISKSVLIMDGQMVVNKRGADKIYKTLVEQGLELERLGKIRTKAASELANLRTKLNGREINAAAEAKISEPFLAARKAYADEQIKAMDTISKFLNYLGITGITQEMLSNMEGSMESHLKLSAELKPIGMFTKLAASLKDAAHSSDIESANLLKNANPLYRETETLNQLARLKSKYGTEVRFATNHKSINGETIQNFSLPSFASETYKSIANSNHSLYNEMKANGFAGKAGWLLDQIRQGSVKLSYLEGLVSADNANGGVERTEMSVREQYLTPLLMFHQNSKFADFVDMTKSDKTVTPVISHVEKFQVLKAGFSESVVEQFQNIFLAEFERVQQAFAGNITDSKMAEGGKYFFFMPAFNYANMKADKTITPEQLLAVWNTDGTPQKVYNAEVIKPLITKYMGAALQAETKAWIAQLKSFGGLELLPQAQMDYYLQKFFGLTPHMVKNEKGRDVQDGFRKVNPDKSIVLYDTEKALEMAATILVKQFVTQGFMMNTFSAMILSGDPAIAFKPNKAKSVNAMIKNTLKEYQKRQAKDVAPGAIPNFEPGSSFVSMTIADPKMQSAMASVNSKYKDQDSIADAQEITTVREQLAVMFAEGKIPDQTYAEMVAIIDAGIKTPNKFYEFTSPAHLEVVLQAQKPVYVSRRFAEGSYAIDYIKSSSFAMLPQFTVGTELDKLRIAMEGSIDKAGKHTGHVNRAVFGSGKKLGQPMNPVQIFDAQGKVIDGVFTGREFSAAQQTLSREGFKIQQEVPFKGLKEHIDLVSQADRFITAGISHMEGFEFPGEGQISGKRLKQIRLETVKEMSKRALAAFTEDIGGIEFSEDKSGMISSKLANPEKFFDKLLAEAITKGYSPNEIELLRTRTQNGRLQVPLWFSGSANKLESMVMSMIGKITVPKIPGKSFVQASSIGIKRYSTEIPTGAGVKYIKSFDPTKGLQFMTKNEGAASGAAQVLVPFNFFSPDGERIKLEDFMAEDGSIDPAKLPDEVLRMVGMRIPNQGHNSMLPIQIVGFLPASMGDLIIVPAEITTQMGSDFDVDKLYTYRGNYFHNAQEKTLSVYAGDSTEKNLQDKYFNVFWSALTHPDMFNRVTNPLDQPDMVTEAAKAEITGGDSLSNFFMPSAQIESYNAQKDAKRLVALTALSGTFMSDIEDMNIGFTDDTKVVFNDDQGNPIELTKLSGVGRSTYVAPDGSIEYRSKHDVNSALQNEVLDYAKNRTIDPLNINLKTYPAVDMLINMVSKNGVSVGWNHIARFTQQPIIKEYVSMLSSSNDNFSDFYQGDQHSKVVKRLIDKYGTYAYLSPGDEIPQIAFSPAELLEMIGGDLYDRRVSLNQLSLLKMFDLLHTTGVLKMRAQSVFNRGPKGPGANFIEASDINQKAQGIINNDTALGGFEELAADGSQRGDDFTKSVGTALQIGDDVMPYKEIQPIISELAQLKNKELLAYDDVLKVNNALKAYMMSSKQMGLSDNVSGRLAELIYDSNGQQNLAKRVAAAKATDWGKANFFLSRLKTTVATKESMPSTVSYMPIKTTVFEDQENTKAIIELLEGTPEQLRLIQDLIDYNYLSGSTGGATSFNRFIPISYIIGRGMDTNMRKIMNFDGWQGFSRNFVQQYLQHNPDFAPRMPKALRGTVEQELNPEARNQINERLTLRKAEDDENFAEAFKGEFPKYFSVANGDGFLLYRFMDYNPTKGHYTYARIDVLGQGSLQEYNQSETYKRSIILVNKAADKTLSFDEEVPRFAPKEFIRMPKTENSSDPFYEEFVQVGENSTTSGDFIDALSVTDSPLLQVLKMATMQDVEINSNLNANERIAEFRLKSNKIQLNMNRIATREQVIQAVEHEYMHAVTARTLADISKMDDAAATKKYGAQTMQAYYSLEELRRDLAERHHGNELMDYATSSIDELIAHAFTHKEVQQILNDTKVAEVTIWSKFAKLISGLIKALVTQMGFDVNSNSALQAVINDAAAIIGSNGKGQSYQSQADSFLGSVYFDDSTTMTVPAEIRTAMKDLEAHKAKLESLQFSQSALSDTERSSYLLRSQEIDAVTADINSLKRVGSFELMAKVGTRQVGWAKEMLAGKSKSMEDLLAAYHTAKTWSTLISNMYDGIDPTLLSDTIKNLQGNASAIEAQVLVEFKNNSGLSMEDFTPESLATSALQAQTRDLGQNKSEVAQVIYERISEQKKYRVEELRKFNAKAETMVAKVKALAKSRGVKYSDLMDKLIHSGNDWGMINNYSPELMRFQDKLQSDLEHKLQVAYNTAGLTPEQKLMLIKAAKKNYKTNLEKKLSYVNVSVLLDHETGELRSGPEAKAELAKLTSEIGADMVDRMVKQAQRNYKQYLTEKESYDNVVEATHENYVNEVTTLFAADLAALKTKEEKVAFLTEKVTQAEELRDEKIRVWEAQNSPIVFYQMLAGLYVKGLSGQFRAYNRLVTAPKLSSTEFFDEKYTELQKDPELVEVYNFIQDNLTKYVNLLPVSVQDKLGDSFLPVIRATDDTLSLGNAWERAKGSVTDALLVRADMLERLQGDERSIPLQYIGNSVDIEERQRDPMVLLSKFADMALHYNGMAHVQAYAELAEQAVIQATRKTSEGKFAKFNTGAEQLAKQVSHYMDVEMYQKARAQEAVMDKSDVYSLDPFKNRQIKKAIADNTAATEALEKQYKDGDIAISEYAVERAKLMKELDELTKDKRHLTGSNVADVAIKITQLKALSWNPMSAIANVTFGVISLSVHANAGTDFDQKTMLSAMATMSNATKNALGASNKTAEKILALMDRTNLMGELLDSDSPGESKLVTRGKERWKKVISPYQMMRQSDYFMKGAIAVAMAKYKMIEVERNGQMVTMSLWDAMDNEGRIEGNPEWYNEEDSAVEKQFQAFRNQAVGVSKVIMGNQDSNSPIMIKRHAMGRLITQFRISWLAEGVAQRFESESFNKQLGRTVKGRYRTYGDLGLFGSLKMLAAQTLGSKTAFEHKGSEIAEVDKENMRKNLSELAWALTMMGIMVAMKAMMPDDEDKKTQSGKTAWFVYNMITRTQGDILFFANPNSATETLANIVPASKVLVDFTKALDGTRRILFDDEDSSFTAEQFRNRWFKTLPPLSLIPKLDRQMSKF
jgi:hypothetical protein